jgi:Sec61beta family
MSAAGPSAGGLRKRTAAPGAGSSARAPAGSQGGTAGGFSVRLYNDASPGFKVGPYFVVMSSVVYLVAVVLLHIWGRIGGKS